MKIYLQVEIYPFRTFNHESGVCGERWSSTKARQFPQNPSFGGPIPRFVPPNRTVLHSLKKNTAIYLSRKGDQKGSQNGVRGDRSWMHKSTFSCGFKDFLKIQRHNHLKSNVLKINSHRQKSPKYVTGGLTHRHEPFENPGTRTRDAFGAKITAT